MYKTVSSCHCCVKTGITLEGKRHLQRLIPTRPLELVARDIFGPLPETTKGNQYVLTISHRHSKLPRTVPTARITATAVACIFIDAWVIY